MENTNFHSFKSFLTERFTAVAVEIFGEVEHIVEEYRAENKRLHDTLNSLLHPEIKLRRIEHQTSTAVVHEQPPEQRAGLGPESPETWHPTIKVEQIEYETGPGEDQPQGPEGAGNMNIIVMPVCVKSDTEQDLSLGQISNSYHDPVVESQTESEFTIKVEEVAEEIAVKNERETHEHLEATADRSHLSGESESTIEAEEMTEEMAVNNEMETHQHLEASADGSRLSRERKNKHQSRAGCEEECGNCLGDMARRGRPSLDTNTPSPPAPPRRKRVRVGVPADVRKDQFGHWPVKSIKRGRCTVCKRNATTTLCEKCGVRLCFTEERNCFKGYHF